MTEEQDQTQSAAETTPEEVMKTEAEQIASLSEKIAALKDQHLRALAEVENVRRRAAKDAEDSSRYAISSFAREMLGVADNFRRALDAIPATDEKNETLKQLIAGVEATERQLLSSLERFGIKKMAPMDLPFDPNFHRVMMEKDDAGKPAGTVVLVLQDGYMIHDRLLREALVAVSKGGPVSHKVDTSA